MHTTQLLAVNMIACILFLLCLCGIGQSSVMVISEKKLAATVGGNVTLQCQLKASQPIFQITWQKETGNFTGPVATCSKVYGERILGYFTNRTAQHTVDTLNVSAITINQVTLEDQGCFKCIFNVYPIGANSGKICLEVYERNISDPILDIRHVESQDGSQKLQVVTCSATGKPAPEISWTTTDGLIVTPETYTLGNPNGTVTIISNFTHRVTRRPGGRAICMVRHPALPSDRYLSAFLEDTADEDSSKHHAVLLIAIIIIPLLCVGLLLWGSWFYKKTSKSKTCLFGSQLEDSESSRSSQEMVTLPNTRIYRMYSQLVIP